MKQRPNHAWTKRERRVWTWTSDHGVNILISGQFDFLVGTGWAIRWREREIAPDGTIKKRLCYEALGNLSRAEAGEILRRKMAEFGSSDGPTRSRVTFLTLAQQWAVDVLPTKYKHSTQKNHRHIMEKHLIPRFGELALCDVRLQLSKRM